MRICTATMHQVTLDLRRSFQTSSHRKSRLEHILVELTADDGRVGWGEIAAPANPYYCPDTTETSWLIAERYLLPALLDGEWDEPRQAADGWAALRGHEFAKAGVDMALWTLAAEQRQTPLAALLGGTRDVVEAGVSLGIEPTVDELLDSIATQRDAGYRRVKLKIAPGWDVEPVRAARDAFPELALQVDANGAYPGDDEAMATLSALDDSDLLMIEQPFAPRDLVSHAALQPRIATPICLDESILGVDDVRTMVALEAGQIVNIKVSRVGGLTPALAVHAVCVDQGLPAWCGGMHEFGVGRAANVALSALPGFTLPSDVSGSDKYYARDVIDPPVIADDGLVTVATTPGLGHAVDRAWVSANTTRTLTLEGRDPKKSPSRADST